MATRLNESFMQKRLMKMHFAVASTSGESVLIINEMPTIEEGKAKAAPLSEISENCRINNAMQHRQ